MTNTIRAIIIDDEPKSIVTLKNLLTKVSTAIEVIADAGSVAQAVELINRHKPELVFLDIQLLDGTGFDVIDQTEYNDYEVIFITAYQQHAIKAFEVAALHYIMKPIRPEHLEEALERLQDHKYDLELQDRLHVYRNNITSNEAKIILPLSDGLFVIRLEEVVRCESSNNYTTFFLREGRQHIVSKPISFYEQLLHDRSFVRTHSKHLVNLRFVERYVKGRGGYVILTDGFRVDVSQTKRQEFLDSLAAYVGEL
ncbi:MAG: hypothetical protein RIS47_617 [Bacteroidota bacterium]|jgi:two-component system LytT family response regulator